ncbi:MAG TPA: RNA polymerase sigma factor [Thermoanaerobaculia bacterium]|jgi:RNA polymerase sigma-70 factor (ECF subfamily)
MADDDPRFTALYKYYPGVLALLRRLGFPPDESQDLAQEIYLRVHRSMKDYRGEAHWAYLEQTVRRVAFNWIRDKHAAKRHAETVSTDVLLTLPDERLLPADESIDRAATAESLYDAIAELPLNDRTILLLQLGGASYEDLRKTLGLSLSAVKSRLNVARERLKELMSREPRQREE